MKELYWINVLGNLNVVTIILFVALSFAVLVILIPSIICLAEAFDNGWEDDIKKYASLIKRTYKCCILPWVILLLGMIFIPSRGSLYMIYGLGGTIDYIKQNDTAKQLPDKVIIALDKWTDNLIVDKEKESENN